MTRAAFLLLAALTLVIPVSAQPGPRLGDCLPELIAPAWGLRAYTPAEIAAIRAIPSLGTWWVSSGDYGYFNIPADHTSAGGVRGHTAGNIGGFYDAGIDLFRSRQTPGIYYALVYADLTPEYASAHPGTHPCAAALIEREAWDNLMHSSFD